MCLHITVHTSGNKLKTLTPVNRSCTWYTSSTSRQEAPSSSAFSKPSEDKQGETTTARLYYLLFVGHSHGV